MGPRTLRQDPEPLDRTADPGPLYRTPGPLDRTPDPGTSGRTLDLRPRTLALQPCPQCIFSL